MNYNYTLLPDDTKQAFNTEIDLNISRHFSILLSAEKSRSEQIEQWNWLKQHSDVLNLIAHTLCHTEKTAVYSALDMQKKQLYEEIRKGTYGALPKQFFQRTDCTDIQEIILWYLAAYQNGREKNCFQHVLRAIYRQNVLFYFDTVKKSCTSFFRLKKLNKIS